MLAFFVFHQRVQNYLCNYLKDCFKEDHQDNYPP